MMTSATRLKVAFVRADFDPYGGAERFTNFLMASLAQHGIECHIFARTWKGEGKDCHFHKVRGFSSPSVLRQASFVHLVRRQLAQEHFDIVQSNERTLSQTIYRAGDGVHARWVELRKGRSSFVKRMLLAMSPFHLYMAWLEKKMFESKELKAIIVNSEMVRREIISRFEVEDEKIHTIYNGVDLETYNPMHRQTVGGKLRQEFDVAPREPIALFVGSGYDRKGVPQLIEAMARMDKPFRLWVVGKDSIPTYQKMAARLGVGDRIRFFGKQRNVQPFYAAADFLVLPTLYDPFPSVALEAMASGLPIIITKQCGAAEVIAHGREGFLLEGQEDLSLSGYMEYLFENKLARDRMSAHALSCARQFPYHDTVRKFLDLYGQMLGCYVG